MAHDQLIKKAESFIRERFLPRLAGLQPEPIVHIVKVSLQSSYRCLVVAAPHNLRCPTIEPHQHP